ncbi:MAG: ribonuclease E/G, partial [Bacteroidaceae bacterium]
MTNEVIIDTQKKEISIALLEDNRLVEFQREEQQQSYTAGNIYIAKVKKLMPGLNACFVDVGHERDAFLHFLDLGPNYFFYQKYLKQTLGNRKKYLPIGKIQQQPILEKDKAIQDVLKVGDDVLVQITKEPISTKGPRLNCDLNFAGRFLILIPFDNKISVSTKIRQTAERNRLKQLIASILP